MKYLLLGDEYKTLFVEDDEQLYSIRYDFKSGEWRPGGNELFNSRVGFDSSEPIDSPYRYGNSDCLKEIKVIAKEEAEAFISQKIDENGMLKLLKQIKCMNRIYD